MLERHHLAIIHAVDKHGTLTEAANALFLTQSALSHGIKKLEGYLGAPVWQKDGRRLRLTQAGQGLLKDKEEPCASAWNVILVINGC